MGWGLIGVIELITQAFILISFHYQTKILTALLSGLVITLTLESMIDIGKQYVSVLGSFQTPIKGVLAFMAITLSAHYLPTILQDPLSALILYTGTWISTGIIVAGYSFALGNAISDWDYLNDGFKILYAISICLIIIGLSYRLAFDQLPNNPPNLLNKTQYYPDVVMNKTIS